MTNKIKCPDCSFEAANKNGLRLHSAKHKDPNDLGVIDTEIDPRYATKEDVNGINASLDKLTEMLTKPNKAMAIEQAPTTKPIVTVDPEKSDKSPVPPKWRQVVDEILGPDFGINVVYPDTGNGFLFKLIVPLDKSNADKAYLELYKVDIRTKSLSYSDGIDGVRKYCELVKSNLKVNKNKPL